MKVSVIIPTFNRGKYIKRAIDSAFAQTFPVDELIIVDDERSTDKIEDTVAALYGSRVRVVKQGGGLSGARRRGVLESCGEWIAFLDSDDEWLPDKNKQMVETAAHMPMDVAWIFGDLRVVTDKGEGPTLFGEFGLNLKESPQIFEDSLSVQYPFQFGLLQGSFIRRNVLLELDCFNEGLQHSEDLFAGFQVACRYKFAAISSVVGRYFRTSDLAENSAVLKGLYGPDYYRARMLAFSQVIRSGRKRPWNKRYANQVQGLCRALAKKGPVSRQLAMEQFRFGGFSLKGMSFFCMAIFGRRGIQVWNAVADFRRRHFHGDQTSVVKKDGFQEYIDSTIKNA